MTDAAHMLSDLSGMVVSLLALRLSRQRATLRYTYGYHQAEVLGALGSVVLVWFMTGGLLVCAYDRFASVQNVNAKLMLATAIFGLITNVMLMVTLGHDHGHGHGGHDDHGHGQSHGHGHGHKEGHDHDCEHDHGHENDHGKDHGHGEGRGHDHDCEHDHGHGESHGDGHDRDHDREHDAHP